MNTNTEHKQGYTCFKKCGFNGNLGQLFAHYKAEPTHHRFHGKNAAKQKRQERLRKQRERAKVSHAVGTHPRHNHLSVVGSKVKIGQAVGFHKNGAGSKSQLAKLKTELQAAIDDAGAKLEKLKFAQEWLKDRMEA